MYKKPPKCFPKQKEPRFSHFGSPGVQLAGESKESHSCKKILEFKSWARHKTASGIFSCKSRKRYPIILRAKALYVVLKEFGTQVTVGVWCCRQSSTFESV